MLKIFIDSCHELVFPSYCLKCEKRLPCRELPLLCSECLSTISYISSPQCSCCGTPFEAGRDHLCGVCLRKSYAFDLARAAIHYREPVPGLISSFKFNGTLTGLATLAHIAQISPGIKDLSEPDIILPVPLHMQRLRERKFNQASLIARACFPDSRGRIRPDFLVRHRGTTPQTGLTGVERRKNLSGAFSLNSMKQVSGKNILLVDDVFTTGSTVNECAKILRKAGARRVEVFTLARAL